MKDETKTVTLELTERECLDLMEWAATKSFQAGMNAVTCDGEERDKWIAESDRMNELSGKIKEAQKRFYTE